MMKCTLAPRRLFRQPLPPGGGLTGIVFRRHMFVSQPRIHPIRRDICRCAALFVSVFHLLCNRHPVARHLPLSS